MIDNSISFKKLKELKTFDPKIIIEEDFIWLKPTLFNYTNLSDIFFIIFIVAILPKQKTLFMFLIFIILILVFLILLISRLSFNNSVGLDLNKRVLVIKPNALIRMFGRKQKEYNFYEIKTTGTESNFDTTGFWLANRRYYLKLILNNKEEKRVISSGKAETIDVIVNSINSIFQ